MQERKLSAWALQGIFWKGAKHFKKCRPLWLTKEEQIGTLRR